MTKISALQKVLLKEIYTPSAVQNVPKSEPVWAHSFACYLHCSGNIFRKIYDADTPYSPIY